MTKQTLLQIASLLFLIHSVSSHSINKKDAEVLSIPGSNCESFTTTDRKLLDYKLLAEKCRNIHDKNRMKIELNFDGIQADLFEEMSNLENLQARYLNLTMIFLKTANLRTIDFSRNKIKKLKLSIGEKLRSLDVSYNELMTVDLSPEGKATSNLKIIDFSHNNLRKLDSISEFEKLEYLDMSSNKIENITEVTFTKMKKLKVLNVSFNNLSSLSGCPFCFLHDLKFLDLSFNSIKTMNVLMEPLKNLRVLDLRVLDLRGNEIPNYEYQEVLKNLHNLRELRRDDGIWKCGWFSEEMKEKYEIFCAPNMSLCCSPTKKNQRKRSISNSHFHATINDKKRFHNVSAIVLSNKTNQHDGEISLKDFFGKLHDINVDNVKTFLKLTDDRIESSVSRLETEYSSIIKKIDADMSVVNSKLDELNGTLSDMVLELSNMDSDNGDMLNVTLNEIIPRTSYIEQDYDDIVYLLKLCIFLLLVAIALMIFKIVTRMRRAKALKRYKMNLLNLETVEHR